MILDWMMVEGLAIGSRKKMPNSERSGNIRHLNLPRRQRTRIDPVTGFGRPFSSEPYKP